MFDPMTYLDAVDNLVLYLTSEPSVLDPITPVITLCEEQLIGVIPVETARCAA